MSYSKTLKVSVSGVRGIVGESLTTSLISDFSSSFGEYVGGGRVVVGRDTRPSGKMIENAVIAGLLAVGAQPVVIGIVPTPTVQIIVDELNANGGIAITASHNTEEWNALKFIGKSGIFLNHIEAAELLDIYNQPDISYASERNYRNMRFINKGFEFHKKRIFKNINTEKIKKSKLKVLVDCCNGAGAYYSESFLRSLGCEVQCLNDEKDGIFRRKPEPTAENLTVLCEKMKNEDFDIGFAQDPDADRIVVIDSDGVPAGEQYSLILAAEHILSKNPGKVVANIQTSKALEHIVEKHNSEIIHSKVGEINVTGKMLKVDAVLGGEGGSGGIIWPKVHPCRDSFTGMALILEMLAERNCGIKEILKDIPRYYSSKIKVPCSSEKAMRVVRNLRKKYKDLSPNTIDGLRLDWQDAWVLIRPSNTEPVMRVNAESLSEQRADEICAEFADEIKK